MEALVECYKHKWLLDEVRKSIPNTVTNSDKLESRIFKQVGSYLLKDIANIGHYREIGRTIHREIKSAMTRQRIERADSIDALSNDDSEMSPQVFEVADDFTPLEDALVVNEWIAELSKGDERRRYILTAWSEGFTDDRAAASRMKDEFGGNTESYRTFINRFRNECRQQRYIF